MPQSKPRRRKGHGEVIQPLTVLQRVSALLKEHLSIFPSKPDLTEEEIEHWHLDLKDYPLEAIEYAFDNWRRNGRFFPVYADILELCELWNPPERNTTERCSAECRAKHGKGYGTGDILWLAKRIFSTVNTSTHYANGNAKMNIALVQSRALGGVNGKNVDLRNIAVGVQSGTTPINWDELLDELDSKREEGPPQWRRRIAS